VGHAHPDFFQGGRLPTLLPPCRRPWIFISIKVGARLFAVKGPTGKKLADGPDGFVMLLELEVHDYSKMRLRSTGILCDVFHLAGSHATFAYFHPRGRWVAGPCKHNFYSRWIRSRPFLSRSTLCRQCVSVLVMTNASVCPSVTLYFHSTVTLCQFVKVVVRLLA